MRAVPSVTRFEFFLMVYHLFLRHNMTYALVEDVLKLINCIFGCRILETSEYIFRKVFESKCKTYTHFYCPSCDMYLGEKSQFTNTSATCACGTECKVSKLVDNN